MRGDDLRKTTESVEVQHGFPQISHATGSEVSDARNTRQYAATSVSYIFNNLSAREQFQAEPTYVGQDVDSPKSVEGKWAHVLRAADDACVAKVGWIGDEGEDAEAKFYFNVVLGFHIGVIRGFDVDVNVDRPSMSSGSAFGERRDPHSVEQSDRRRRVAFVEVYALQESR
ncbi:hypothetical protein EV714DRAFT_240175 [Schizophyllum commune]